MSSPAPTRFTEAEYLALESVSEQKHEYIDGRIEAMAGARPAHNMLAANMTASLVQLSRGGPCVTLTSDQRVHVPATKLYTYPDVTVACGDRKYDGGNPPSLLNPTVIVEVTSETTEDFDRGTKFLHYQGIPELSDYVIVSHREHRIDHYRLVASGHWDLVTHTSGDAIIEIPALGGSLRLADVYQQIDLSEGN